MKRVIVLAFCAAATACAAPMDDELEGEREQVGRAELPIINGTPDTTHPSAVALVSFQGSGCSGSIIHVSGSDAYVLTAAHCIPMDEVRIGTNYFNPEAVLSVQQQQRHPNYQGDDYDIAMIRATGATPSTPVVGPMSPAEDIMAPGTQIEHVGFGVTSPGGGGNNSQRLRTVNTIDQVGSIEIGYSQPSSGPCNGDSGGPGYVQVSDGTQRVAGVVSRGDPFCNEYGISGKVSAFYDSFIVPFIGQTPTTSAAATTSTGVGGMGAGGAGAGEAVATGAGAGDAWVAPDTEEVDYDGTLVTSGCQVGPAGSGNARDSWLAWLWVALAGVGVGMRRRRG